MIQAQLMMAIWEKSGSDGTGGRVVGVASVDMSVDNFYLGNIN